MSELNPSLTPKQKKRFRAIGHGLHPIVTVSGNGLSEAVLREIDRALTDHELIKVKMVCEDRNARKTLLGELTERMSCTVIQAIGSIGLIYRAAEKPNPALSNILRSGIL